MAGRSLETIAARDSGGRETQIEDAECGKVFAGSAGSAGQQAGGPKRQTGRTIQHPSQRSMADLLPILGRARKWCRDRGLPLRFR